MQRLLGTLESRSPLVQLLRGHVVAHVSCHAQNPTANRRYQVHGEFEMAAEDRAFPDTYIFTLAQLHAAGLSKTLIKEKLLEFEQQLNDECQRELHELDEEPVEQPREDDVP